MSSGANIVAGAIDILESAADVAPVGTTRIRRKGGVLQSSTDGAAFGTLGGSTILARAQSLLPGSSLDTVLGMGDFDSSSPWVSTGSLGTVALSVTAKGGVVVVDTTATSGRFSRVFPAGAPSYVDNARTSPWYFYMRAAMGTGVDAAGFMAGSPVAISAGAPANPAVRIGANGAVSTANFSWQILDAGGADVAHGTATAALDTNYHDFEIANDGTTVTFYLDGVSIGSTASTNIGAVPMMPQLVTLNGATSASRLISVDKQYFAIKGN